MNRAYVQTDIGRLGVAVFLFEQVGHERYAIGQPTDVVFQEMDRDAAAAVAEPTLRLPEDMARALLDALAAHFGGTSDVRTLRKDYMAERARVDKMIDHLVGRRPS
jgi:hypothetical protein